MLTRCSLAITRVRDFQEEFVDAGGVEGGTLSAEQFDEWMERFKVKLAERMEALSLLKQPEPSPKMIPDVESVPPAPAQAAGGSDELNATRVEVRGDESAEKPKVTAGGGCCVLQ